MPRRGTSRQDYRTPPEFLDAVRRRFGEIGWDLAATVENAVHRNCFGVEEDSLRQPWAERLDGCLAWLNPPFANIAPWVEKCAAEGLLGARIILLTPASLGAEWFVRHVQPNALSLVLRPRLTFVGETTPYPKDCMVSSFGVGMVGIGTWRWISANDRALAAGALRRSRETVREGERVRSL